MKKAQNGCGRDLGNMKLLKKQMIQVGNTQKISLMNFKDRWKIFIMLEEENGKDFILKSEVV